MTPRTFCQRTFCDLLNSHQPDKEKPARHVRYLQEWLRTNVHLNLNQAPFKKEDGCLREDGLTCIDCPNRTGRDKALFEDIGENNVCLNPICFEAKIQQFVQIRKSDIEAKSNKPTALISAFYGSGNETNGAIGKEHYQIIERKADRCEFAEQAVIADGTEIGKAKWICREADCKDHRGRIAESHQSYSPTLLTRSAAPVDRNHRKQELFDIKVDEEVRKRVMKEAVKTYGWPLERGHLNEAVKEFYRRIPSEHQRVICEVMNWTDDDSGKLRYDASAILDRVAALSDAELGQFLMLCSFAHYGTNQYKQNRVDQEQVVELSKDRGINHALLDAEVRAEFSPKKYKPQHDAYLEAVRSGISVAKPAVHEEPTDLPLEPAKKRTKAGSRAGVDESSQPRKATA